jgi:hypothetical protein
MSGEGCILHMKIGYGPRRERITSIPTTMQDTAGQDKPRQAKTMDDKFTVDQKKNKLIPNTNPARDKSIARARACTVHYKTYRIGTIEILCVTVSQPMSYKKSTLFPLLARGEEIGVITNPLTHSSEYFFETRATSTLQLSASDR